MGSGTSQVFLGLLLVNCNLINWHSGIIIMTVVAVDLPVEFEISLVY